VSKRINVNPDHYKVAGRERPGDVRKGPKQKPRLADGKAQTPWEGQRSGRSGRGRKVKGA
jgi:hypothetical protein